jgi:hypothetical protein
MGDKQQQTTTPNRPVEPRERDPDGEKKRLYERFAAHRRWIGGEPDDPCCRGFD